MVKSESMGFSGYRKCEALSKAQLSFVVKGHDQRGDEQSLEVFKGHIGHQVG